MPWTTATTRATGFAVTAAVWNAEHVDNMNYLKEVAYQEFTADVTTTATTAPTAVTVVSAGAITFEAVPHLIEFSAAYAQPDSAAINRQMLITLWDGSTDLGPLAQVRTPASGIFFAPVHRARRLTPTAASHTYQVKAWVNAGTGTVGATAQLPGYIRIVKVPV